MAKLLSCIYSILLAICLPVSADEWFPPSQAKANRGSPTTLRTSGVKSYKEVWYTVEDRQQFIFSVKACGEAYLVLASYPSLNAGFNLEISLGSEGNTKSWIRDPALEKPAFITETLKILHCNELRTFWVQWTDSAIAIGRGPTIGEQKFMNANNVQTHHVTSIGLASDKGNAAVWKVQENSADQMILFTPDEHKYESMWKSISDRNYFTFSIMAAAHAHIVVTEGEGQTGSNVVEFILGGWDNNKTAIRSHIHGDGNDDLQASTETPHILNAKEFRDFWISWMNGTMELGRGLLYGRDRVVKWQDPRNIMPRYLSVTTAHGISGDWLFQDDQESNSYIFTKEAEGDDPFLWFDQVWIETPRKQFFTFQVKACRDATLLLSDVTMVNPDFSIEISIGYDHNTKTVFRYLDMLPPGNIAEADTLNILSCNDTRHFWLSWHDNTIRLGNWHIYDQNIILEAELGEGYPLRAIALATPHDNGLWVVRELYGERLNLKTPKTFDNFDFMWRSVTQQDYFNFRVKACSDAHLAVAPTCGVDLTEAFYDIVISGWDNTRTQIRRVQNGDREDVGDPVDTTGLLDCDQFKDFWVSWTNNVVQVGKGIIPRHHVLLSHSLDDIYPIKAVAISTGFDHEGEWRIDNDNGDYLVYYTNSKVNENSIGIISDTTWVVFNVRACANAMIYMQSLSGNGEHYEITLGAEDNTKSTITARGVQVASEDTPNLLSCEDDRHIWISWENGVLAVGHNSLYGLDQFMEYKDPTPIPIEIMHFHSRDYDLDCRWRTYYNQTLWTSFKTPIDFGYHYVWETVEHKQGLVFSVQACSDVHVILSDVIRDVTDRYDIVIGGWANTKSAIRTFEQKEHVSVSTPDINSCNEHRSFWLTWQNGAIEVGRGEIIGSDRVMDFQILDMYPVRAVGFSTGYAFNGTWNIKLAEELLPTAPPATENPGDGGDDVTTGGLDGGAIAGIVIGILVAMILVIFLVTMVMRGSLTLPVNLNCLKSGEDEEAPIAPENQAPEQVQDDNVTQEQNGAATEEKAEDSRA